MGAVLSVRHLRHRRGGVEVLAIDSLDLAAGDRLAVLGPNGAGKTSLLRLLAALERPTSGRVELDGVPTTRADAGVRRRIGYATQRPGLLSTTVRRNVELPLRWRGASRSARRNLALAALDRLGVAHLAERRAASLSGGEAQRVSLARALALAPAMLLLDEPAAGLDAEARTGFLDDLDDALEDRATTVVHVSHRADEALRLADRVAVLSAGEILQIADPATVVNRPADATVARLVGYDNVLSVGIDPHGQILLGGAPCGLTAPERAGSATLAAWGGSIRLGAPGTAPLEGSVERVGTGPGRWDVLVHAGATLRAHLPLGDEPPRPGDRVAVSIDGARATVISSPARREGGAQGAKGVRPQV